MSTTTERERPPSTGIEEGPKGELRGVARPSRSTIFTGTQAVKDLFAEARLAYTVADVWQMLRLPGEPRKNCRSPFREESHPSFTIFDDGRGWKDHGTGEGGDVIEFIKIALATDYHGVREWLLERLGIDRPEGFTAAPQRPVNTPEAPKSIKWPAELVAGTQATWQAFSEKMRLPYPGIVAAVGAGTLRFCKVDGLRCYVVTDAANRAGEIRRCDGGKFGQTKAYPLSGVDKSWLPGAEMLKGTPKTTGIFLTEGPKDYLAALGVYSTYRRTHHGKNSWLPAAVLGANCNKIHPELIPWFRGRRVRIAPDGDEAGDKMAETWKGLLLDLGCTVDVVTMPRGKDLFDVRGEIEPEGLFR